VFVCSAVLDGVTVAVAVMVGLLVMELVFCAVVVVLGVARCEAV
jgi:hypothetical protein